MFEYKTVRCPAQFSRSGKIDPANYEQTIQQHAKEGYRLVQIFLENPAAIPSEYVLIFERANTH